MAKCDWNGIAGLLSNRGLGPDPEAVVRDPRETSGFEMGNPTVLGGQSDGSLASLRSTIVSGVQ